MNMVRLFYLVIGGDKKIRRQNLNSRASLFVLQALILSYIILK